MSNYIIQVLTTQSVSEIVINNAPGRSAYETWLLDGNTGTTTDFINSLQGETGPAGPAGPAGTNGAGVPAGGTTGQVLAKIDGVDYNTEWVNQTGGGGPTVWGSITGNLVDQTDLSSALNLKQDLISGSGPNFVIKESGGTVTASTVYSLNSFGGVNLNLNDPIQGNNYRALNSLNYNLNPTETATSATVQVSFLSVDIDQNDSGIEFGTNGLAVSLDNKNIQHKGSSNIGRISFMSNNFDLGKTSTGITIDGVSYMSGFGTIRENSSLNGGLEGYGFSPRFEQGSSLDQTNAFVQAFYDSSAYSVASSYHTSFAATPTVHIVPTGKNITGLNFNPLINTMQTNAGVIGASFAGTINSCGSNSFYHGVNVSPNIAQARYAAGLQVSMDNVSLFPGVISTVTVQDLTYAFNSPVDNSGSSIQYLSGGTAGSEAVVVNGQNIEVTIESGVSTANQIKTAIEAIPSLNAAISVTVTGSGANAQTTSGPTNFSAGEPSGSKLAAYLDGNVQITGNLQFGGALSIGQLNAFASQTVTSSILGQPNSIHSLVSAVSVADNTTVNNADTLGINTAMILNLGTNAQITTSFVGIGALALPAVVNMATGSSIDQLAGAVFAISMDVAATGGTIDNLDLCRSLAIPNGVTAVTKMAGYKFELPFGNPASTAWGFYESPGVNNYMAGNLLIGGTPSSDDTVSNASVALEIKSSTKAFVLSRMSTTQRNALTAINGMLIYNTTDNKFQGYENGSWVNLV